MTDETNRYLLTEGVTSIVLTEHPGPRGWHGIGHVALFDWDSHVSPADVREFYKDGDLWGPTFVFESSDGSYHGWNLQVRSFADTSRMLQEYRDDTKHRGVGDRRGWWRLRVGEKRRITNDVYKPAPEYVARFAPVPNTDTPARVSNPHLELARVCGVPDDVVSEVRDLYRPVGDQMEVVAYVTMTDIEKHIRRRSEVA